MTTGGEELGQERWDEAETAIVELVESLTKEQLERLTIDAVREYRAQLAKASAIHKALESAKARGNLAAAEDEENYARVMLAVRAQEIVVAALIDHLGYNPMVTEN